MILNSENNGNNTLWISCVQSALLDIPSLSGTIKAEYLKANNDQKQTRKLQGRNQLPYSNKNRQNHEKKDKSSKRMINKTLHRKF